MVKMAGRSFGKKKIRYDCHRVLWALVRGNEAIDKRITNTI